MNPRFAILYLLGALIVSVSGSLAGTTRASYTDTAAAGSATFTTGSIDLRVSADANCSSGAYTETIGTAIINVSGKGPGEPATGSVCIKNVGTLISRWSLTGTINDTVSGSLKGAMKLRFWTLNSTGASSGTACMDGLNPDGSDVFLALSPAGTPAAGPATIGGIVSCSCCATATAPSTAPHFDVDLAHSGGLHPSAVGGEDLQVGIAARGFGRHAVPVTSIGDRWAGSSRRRVSKILRHRRSGTLAAVPVIPLGGVGAGSLGGCVADG